ncbi:MAG: class I SAM-dependent RNA methyltransferase [Clostridia bacterium]|nr:class I SAM-dependent RNA methyltransferase [Clostridia bacterium]
MRKVNEFPEKLDITITCASGVEKVVKSELVRLGYDNVPAINGGFSLSGSKLDVARLNINLRAADRVYIKLKEFPVLTFDDLFDGVKSINWENYICSDGKVLVNGKCVKSKIFAISACQSIVKKAIVERLVGRFGGSRMIEVGSLYEVEFSIFKDVCSVYLNTSGAGLHKRGYRDLVGIAPIKETLASSLVLLSDFYKDRPFADPFCGSGTIAIEAARIALNIAGGIGRRFAFCDWENFEDKYFDLAFTEAKDKETRNIKLDFLASDIDPKAVKLAKRHAERAGVLDKIRFEVKDVKNFSTDLKYGTIVTNPPYGERVYDIKEAEGCYKGLRTAYDKLCGWSAFIITSAKNFEKSFGKRADRERKLYNSNKECRYYYYYANKPRGIKND